MLRGGSFNFDCLLHEDRKSGIFFDYLLNFHAITKTRELSYLKGKGILLIKLHGSVDWGFNPKTNEINLDYLPVRIDKYYSADGSPRSVEEPYIFLPHQTTHGTIDQLWERARGELKQADKIVVIGYSFPDYDKKVIELFQENVGSEVKWEVIDSYEERRQDKKLEFGKIRR